ncbi:hypothetical protein ACP70R_023133 [Stipagrostis hirtigluma subsp. patula]
MVGCSCRHHCCGYGWRDGQIHGSGGRIDDGDGQIHGGGGRIDDGAVLAMPFPPQAALSTLAAVPKPATPCVERPVARPSSTPHRVKATPRARDARQHQRRRPNFLPGVHLEPQASRFLPCTPAPAISPAKRQASPAIFTLALDDLLHGNRMQLYGYW